MYMQSRTPVIWTPKGNEKQFELARVQVIGINCIFNIRVEPQEPEFEFSGQIFHQD